jgi:hypothetical protein
MTAATTITVNHCIIELQRTISSRKIHYAKLVAQKKMTQYTKQSRIEIMETLLRLCYKAAEEENNSVLKELKQLPKQ